MKFIDKISSLNAGHNITDDYLDTFCRINDGEGHYHYQNIDYGGTFGTTTKGAKARMLQLTMDSQDCLCCYCMRKISIANQEVTLEHIIPQHCTKEDFELYMMKNVSPLTANNVVRTADFTGKPNPDRTRRPHTVTYENLVASCSGTFPDKGGTSQCCNNKRGDKRIYPMFYVATVNTQISYMQDGTMLPDVNCLHADEFRETIEHVRLNNTNLKDIRRLWHLLSQVDYEQLKDCLINRTLRRETLMSVLFKDTEQSQQDFNISAKYTSNDEYWRTFLLYRWFHRKI